VIILGDCLTELRSLADESVDSIVTDPPYGLAFMGKKWDYDVPGVEVWKECFRVLKPGGHLLSFFGSRTYHRGVIPIEDAGFEIRDQIMWVYGSGFPKSHNIGKAVDKLQGNEKPSTYKPNGKNAVYGKNYGGGVRDRTPADNEWDGGGTALKPAHEPIVVARKPVQGTVAENVLRFSTGGMNIDGCRVETESRPLRVIDPKPTANGAVYAGRREAGKGFDGGSKAVGTTTQGRFPANVIHDGSQTVLNFFPDTKSGADCKRKKPHETNAMAGTVGILDREEISYGDKGSAARFFYCAKASKKDRDEGLEALETPKENLQGLDTRGRTLIREDGTKSLVERWKPKGERKNNHPTVKPTDLMRYLCRLVTPPGGVVLDPFMGSGSTGKAAQKEGFEFIGIEREPEYVEIARQRI